MAALILPRRFHQQPQGAVQPDALWMQRGLHRLWNFTPAGGTRCVVTGADATLSELAGVTMQGLSVQALSGNTGPTTLPVSLSNILPITLVVVYKQTAGVVAFGAFTAYWHGIYASGTYYVSTAFVSFDGEVTPQMGREIDQGYRSVAITMGGANDLRVSLNGGSVASDTSCIAPTGALSLLRLGTDYEGTNKADCYFRAVGVLSASVSNAELMSLSSNPWQLFRAQPRRLWIDLGAGGGGVTGTAANTTEAFTSAASGTVDVAGTAANTLADFTSAAAGELTITGTAANTLDAFTSAAAGSVGDDAIDGTAANTVDAFTSAAVGAVEVAGAAANTIDAFTSSAVGAVDVSGTAANTLDAITSVAAGIVGDVGVLGEAANTVADFTSVATGVSTIAGDCAITMADFISSAAGAVSISGTAANTLQNFTSIATDGTVVIDSSPSLVRLDASLRYGVFGLRSTVTAPEMRARVTSP